MYSEQSRTQPCSQGPSSNQQRDPKNMVEYSRECNLGRLPFVRTVTGRPKRTGSHQCKWKGFFATFSRQRSGILRFRMIWKRSLYLFSEQIADYFELLVPCYHCDGFRNHFQVKSMTFELLTHLLAFVSIHIWYTTHQTKKTESWALANQEIYTCHQILDCTLLTFRAEITSVPTS